MLKLQNVTKDYVTGDSKVEALRGVSISFRQNEFVSILGPSGCGKTTLLNIVGGLDQYTEGDLIIEGKSTKLFADSDWDSYRNHSIGFVFQSYNLIPHQSVLANVELALTLSGVSKSERKAKAIEALKKVGLDDQIYKKPNQLSGGQMQRVAIARAIVNNPHIILADEPTGALDTETSVQVMEILKEISQEKLVIMVTHNPQLADRYSTRIVKLLDGKVVDDTLPYDDIEEKNVPTFDKVTNFCDVLHVLEKIEDDVDFEVTYTPNYIKIKSKKINYKINNENSFSKFSDLINKSYKLTENVSKEKQEKIVEWIKTLAQDTKQKFYVTHNPNTMYYENIVLDEEIKIKKHHKTKKVGMSFMTALGLSLNNLFTKKTRTILTAFAGSIGIIGIALILSLSSGFQGYIDRVEKDTLSTYPIVIQEKSMDLSSMLESLSKDEEDIDHDFDAVYSNNVMSNLLLTMLQGVKTNNLESFKKYYEENKSQIEDEVVGVSYGYNVKLNVYKNDYLSTGRVTKLNPFNLPSSLGDVLGGNTSGIDYMTENMVVWNEMLDNQDLLDEQYEVVYGSWPKSYDELIIVIDQNNEINDYVLYALGLKTEAELYELLRNINNPNYQVEQSIYQYSDLCNLTYKIFPESYYYQQNDDLSWTDISTSTSDMIAKLNSSINVKVSGVVKLKETAEIGSITGVVGYTQALSKRIIELNNDSDIIKAQTSLQTTNVMTGEEIDETTYEALLTKYGKANLDKPSSISIYPSSFNGKEKIDNFIQNYNKTQTEENKIQYTDYVGIMMSSISKIVDSVTYVLIAFVGISLLVSSIMIGIITYISVLERTKEIGVLRSIGASKGDISRVFNAETMIIGFSAGALGILITVLLNIPISLVIKHLSGIAGVASLPLLGGVILILISMLLTIISGLIPSRIAAKKDPVIALRTE